MMSVGLRNALAAACLAASTPAFAQIVFYEHDGFEGRSFTSEQSVADFQRFGFNDRASSVMVMRERWEACENAGFGGRCVVLRPGKYESLSAMGLNDRVSSVRAVSRGARVEDQRYAPPPLPVYDNYRRKGEALFEARVTSVRAILGPPERRCWIEREHVPGSAGDANAAGALVGALIGGVLGYQSGPVAADAREGGYGNSGDVQRCAHVQGQNRPDHWEVTYDFRGREHRMQTTFAPGPTITVNAQGEPRA